MLTSGIYGIVNLFDGKIYVGSAQYIRARLGWHNKSLENGKHHNILLQRAWNKHSEEAKAKISAGGKGLKKSIETKARMSEYHLNRSESHRTNHSAAMKKRIFTPEHRQKLVEANARVKARKLLTKELKDV